MKKILSISLGEKRNDYEFKSEFLDQKFHIKRIGTDGDFDMVANILEKSDKKFDAIGIGDVKFPYFIGSKKIVEEETKKLHLIASKMKTPVTSGDELRNVSYEWAVRHLQFKFGNYFNNSRVLFLSGMKDFQIATALSIYTNNLIFADPIIENGISKFIKSIKDLKLYVHGLHDILNWTPNKYLDSSLKILNNWNSYIIRKAAQKSHIIVIPNINFYEYVKNFTLEDLAGKIIITSTAYQDRVEFLKERGVNVIIDTTPKLFDQVVGANALQAIITAALDKPQHKISDDDLLEIISEKHLEPHVIYPSGKKNRINRFAFVIHPLSQEDFKKDKSLNLIYKVTPTAFSNVIEKIMAYSPPFLYSKVTGIKSPTGAEVEGWLISIGGTPKQMLIHSPEFTYRRLLRAAKMAKKLGAQIMGLGAFTKVVGDAGVTVARRAEIPITTGNSYSASGALWAAADAVRRMGLIKVEHGKKIKGKVMVIGATGAIGSVCSRLVAKAFDELYMVGIEMANLLALRESILAETPDVKLHLSTRADKDIGEMDVVVTATSGAGKKILDIEKVKPGCVITDVARPLDLPPQEVAKRPDVLVIESGEILLPGEPKMKNIGLPPKIAYACLAETIVLALEGRFEVFTVGREIKWEKVREIYKMGLKHGMKLAAISGVNGIFSDEDIAKVKKLALEKLNRV